MEVLFLESGIKTWEGLWSFVLCCHEHESREYALKVTSAAK